LDLLLEVIDYIKIVIYLMEPYFPPYHILQEHHSCKNTYLLLLNGEASALTIRIDDSAVTISGSLPYLLHDNNFEYANHAEAINKLSHMLDLNLKKGIVEKFEYGATFEVPLPALEYLNNALHLNYSECERFKHRVRFRNVRGGGSILKLYDAGKNLRNKWSSRREETRKRLKATVFCKHKYYLKVEKKYKSHKSLFKQWGILEVSKLLDPSFLQNLQIDLLKTYQAVDKGIYVQYSDIKTHSFLLGALAAACKETGKHPKKMFSQQLNSHKDLNREAKKARMKLFNQWCKSIKADAKSPYDISSKLKAKLKTYLYWYEKGVVREPLPDSCKVCSEPIKGRKKEAKYCSSKCKNHFHNTLRSVKPLN